MRPEEIHYPNQAPLQRTWLLTLLELLGHHWVTTALAKFHPDRIRIKGDDCPSQLPYNRPRQQLQLLHHALTGLTTFAGQPINTTDFKG